MTEVGPAARQGRDAAIVCFLIHNAVGVGRGGKRDTDNITIYFIHGYKNDSCECDSQSASQPS